MEVRDHEIRIGDVHVDAKRSNEEPRHTADQEQSNKAEPVDHRRIVGNGTFKKRGRPVEYLDGRRDRDRIAQEGEYNSEIDGLGRYEEMVSPHQKPEHGNSKARHRDEFISEDI